MGRPINKNYTGNTTGSGQQIAATAYFPGDSQTRASYISRQVATNTYNMAAANGTASGRVQLVDGGVALTPGQANITVTPYGSTGSGAAATAKLGAGSVVYSTAGTGVGNVYYVPGQTLLTSGGTGTAANLYVSTVSLGNIFAINQGANYTVGDQFIWGASAGAVVPAIATVGTTNATGAITSMTFTPNNGSISNVSLTNTTPYSSTVTTNVSAAGATFRVRWGIADLGIITPGDYTTAPANPITLTGSATGVGATANVAWEVSNVVVSNGGSAYQAVRVTIAGNAKALGVVNVAGGVTSVVVTDPGSGYTTTNPTVTIAPIDTVQYASEIKNRTVNTFSGNTYEWVDSATTPVSGEAKLQTA